MIKVTLSANAGVCIQAGEKKIWVDALFDGADPGFSSMDRELQNWVVSGDLFNAPDYICYTHCHADHYSRELTARAAERWPAAKLVLPQQDFSHQILLTGQVARVEEPGFSMEFFRLPHAGEQYADVPLYGMLMETPAGNILLPGDCEPSCVELKDAVNGRKIDLAIVDFPWITLRRAQKFINEHLMPEHIFVYHLPFDGDDVNHYRQSAARAAQMMPNDVRLLMEPKQTEII